MELRSRAIQIQRWVRRQQERLIDKNILTKMMNTKAILIQKYCRGYLAQRQITTAKNSFKISLNLQQLEDSVKHRKLKIATDLQVKLAYLWRRKLREKMRLLEQQLAARERERAQILAKQIQTKKKVKRSEN